MHILQVEKAVLNIYILISKTAALKKNSYFYYAQLVKRQKFLGCDSMNYLL